MRQGNDAGPAGAGGTGIGGLPCQVIGVTKPKESVLSYGAEMVFGLFVQSIALKFSPASVLSAVFCSSFLGIAFGFLPARNAARLDPIQALARE